MKTRYWIDENGRPLMPEGDEDGHTDIARRIIPEEILKTLDYAGHYRQMFATGHIRAVQENRRLDLEAKNPTGTALMFAQITKGQKQYIKSRQSTRFQVFLNGADTGMA